MEVLNTSKHGFWDKFSFSKQKKARFSLTCFHFEEQALLTMCKQQLSCGVYHAV
jgi:hypothetical protein